MFLVCICFDPFCFVSSAIHLFCWLFRLFLHFVLDCSSGNCLFGSGFDLFFTFLICFLFFSSSSSSF
jgi:hypothetical protein